VLDDVISILSRKTNLNGLPFNKVSKAHSIAGESLFLWKQILKEFDDCIRTNSNDIYNVAINDCKDCIFKSIEIDRSNSYTIINDTIKLLNKLYIISDSNLSDDKIDKIYNTAIKSLLAWNIVTEKINIKLDSYRNTESSALLSYCNALKECKQIIESYMISIYSYEKL